MTTDAAERVRRFRQRQRDGLHHVRLVVGDNIIDMLIRRGWLAEANSFNREMIAAGLEAMLTAQCNALQGDSGDVVRFSNRKAKTG